MEWYLPRHLRRQKETAVKVVDKDDGICQIPISNAPGEFFWVSPKDRDRVMAYAPWCRNPDGYAVSGKLGRTLGPFIMGGNIPSTHVVDHISRNRSDYRRSNLAIRTRIFNAQNKSKIAGKSSSDYYGVSFRKAYQNWSASICISGENIHIGTFKTELEAAYERDAYLVKRPDWSELGYPLNFPDRDYSTHVLRKKTYTRTKRKRDDDAIRTEAKDVDEQSVQLIVGGGHALIVDKVDYEKLKHHNCGVSTYRHNGYSMAYVKIHPKKHVLCRYILGVEDPEVHVDHLDGNTLNCRKSNLRAGTRVQNAGNRKKRRTVGAPTSHYIGVHKQWKNYEAAIRRRQKVVFEVKHESEEFVTRKRDLFILDNREEYTQRLNYTDWSPELIAHWRAAK